MQETETKYTVTLSEEDLRTILRSLDFWDYEGMITKHGEALYDRIRSILDKE